MNACKQTGPKKDLLENYYGGKNKNKIGDFWCSQDLQNN